MIEKVLVIMINANLNLKGEKCLFASDKLIFLGHEISKDGIRQDPKKLMALKALKPPTDKDGVRRFLGMSGYYRKFVPNFATISEPLTRLIRKNQPFVWEEEQKEAFRMLIATLAENATLAHFNHTDPLMLKTDASKYGIAAILLQQQDGDWKMITCCSRRLSSSEQNYGITHLEGLAIVYSVQKLRSYLLGKLFTIVTDHAALSVLGKGTTSNVRLRRWALILSEFNFEIRYTKGKLHEDVDCLSRAPVNDELDDYIDNKVYHVYVPTDLLDWISSYTDEESQGIFDDATNERNEYKLRHGAIYYRNLLYVPESKRLELVVNAHQGTGHGGTRVTAVKLSEFYWPEMTEYIKKVVESCHSCQLRKAERAKPAGRMFHHEASEPLEIVAVDAWHTC